MSQWLLPLECSVQHCFQLELFGIGMTEEESSHISDVSFLEEIMTLNEQLEEQSLDSLMEIDHKVKGKALFFCCF